MSARRQAQRIPPRRPLGRIARYPPLWRELEPTSAGQESLPHGPRRPACIGWLARRALVRRRRGAAWSAGVVGWPGWMVCLGGSWLGGVVGWCGGAAWSAGVIGRPGWVACLGGSWLGGLAGRCGRPASLGGLLGSLARPAWLGGLVWRPGWAASWAARRSLGCGAPRPKDRLIPVRPGSPARAAAERESYWRRRSRLDVRCWGGRRCSVAGGPALAGRGAPFRSRRRGAARWTEAIRWVRRTSGGSLTRLSLT